MNGSGLRHRHTAPTGSGGTLRTTEEEETPVAKALAATVEIAHHEPVQDADAVHVATNPPADPHLDRLDPPPPSVRLQKFRSEPPISGVCKGDEFGEEQRGGKQQRRRRGVAESTRPTDPSVPAAAVEDQGVLTHAATAPTHPTFATDRLNPNRGQRSVSKRERPGKVNSRFS